MSEKPTLEEGASIDQTVTDVVTDDTVTTSDEGNPVEETLETQESDATETSEHELTLSVEEVAQLFDAEPDSFDVNEEGKLVIKGKIDGQEKTATFKDVLKTYQTQGHLDNQNREVKQLQEQLKAQLADGQKQAQERLGQLENVTQLAWAELMQEQQGIDWETLRAEKPEEFAAKQVEMQNRQAQLRTRYQQIQQQKAQYQSQLVQSNLGNQQEKLLEALPSWKDPEVMQKEQSELMQYGAELGYSDQLLANIGMPQAGEAGSYLLVKLLKDSLDLKRLKESRPEVTNKVRSAPRISRPSASKPETAPPKSIEDVFYS